MAEVDGFGFASNINTTLSCQYSTDLLDIKICVMGRQDPDSEILNSRGSS